MDGLFFISSIFSSLSSICVEACLSSLFTVTAAFILLSLSAVMYEAIQTWVDAEMESDEDCQVVVQRRCARSPRPPCPSGAYGSSGGAMTVSFCPPER